MAVINFCVLCTVKADGQSRKSEQKPTANNIAGFNNHSFLLTIWITVIRGPPYSDKKMAISMLFTLKTCRYAYGEMKVKNL